jgi:hypothetical protein
MPLVEAVLKPGMAFQVLYVPFQMSVMSATVRVAPLPLTASAFDGQITVAEGVQFFFAVLHAFWVLPTIGNVKADTPSVA